jgi:hypothetical protein
MDEFERQLQRRLEVLSEAVPLRAARATARPVARRSSPVGRGWSPGLGGLAALGLLLLVGITTGLLFMGGGISGVLQSVGGPLATPLPGMIGTGGDGGYWDTPCADIQHCPSPVPTIDPAVAPQAVAVSVPSLEIPIDRMGHYSIPVGTAVLANGILREARMTLEENIRTDIELEPSVLRLVLIGEAGTPLTNAYEQGWRPGTEKVDVRIEFDVVSLDAPTSITVTDILVR